MAMECCKTGFKWDGKPTGKETTLGKNRAYVSGTNKEAAVMIVHDVFGWTFNNERLLADHFAAEADVTCYLPDFFGGEVVNESALSDPEERKKFDVMEFIGRNSKELRQPEIFGCAKALKAELGFKKVGVIGYCYGAWACARLGAKGNDLVDCIAFAHPSLLEKSEIDAIGTPIQICAPETDPAFTPELKEYSLKVLPTLNIEWDYQYFPGLTHGFATKGDMNDPMQRKGLERAKNAAVYWFQQHLHPHLLASKM